VRAGQRALDVGCGPGALTAELASRLGAGEVCAVDPSDFLRRGGGERLPGVTVSVAAAERLPFPDGAFDAVLAQLVVHFMADPVAGLREMGRGDPPGRVVGAVCGTTAAATARSARSGRTVRELIRQRPTNRAGWCRRGQLAGLFGQPGWPGRRPPR